MSLIFYGVYFNYYWKLKKNQAKHRPLNVIIFIKYWQKNRVNIVKWELLQQPMLNLWNIKVTKPKLHLSKIKASLTKQTLVKMLHTDIKTSKPTLKLNKILKSTLIIWLPINK